MKRIMELNGVANIDLMLQVELNEVKDDKTGETIFIMNQDTVKSIKDQLVCLERYMLAYHKAVCSNVQTPMWHEVIADPISYPRNRDSKY